MITSAVPAGGESSAPVDAAHGDALPAPDLDAFAAQAAHQVGEGLSLVAGYSALLAERHGAALGHEGRETLAAMQTGVERLRIFTGDLLDLSAAGRRELEPQPVAANEALAGACLELGPYIERADVRLDIGALPTVTVDRVALERVCVHMLRSALAAIGRGPGRIAVEGDASGGQATVNVRDDGDSLAAEDAGALFEPFARARGRGPLVGAGVSMAICRRLLERQGGTVRAAPGRDAGATLSFTLPCHGGGS